MRNNIGVFILSNGRPNNVLTYRTLKKSGYSGKIYIILDNEDQSIDEYKKKYKDEIIIFNKSEYYNLVDNGDNFKNYRSTTHVRNAIFDIAKNLGYEYFLMLDDDYTSFNIRFDSKLNYIKNNRVINKSIDKFFDCMVDFMISIPNLKTVCFSQGGDWFGGWKGPFGKKIFIKRKAMNSFFCCTERRFWFFSRLNEDVNTYMVLGNRGDLFFTINQIELIQKATQSSSGGMTSAYKESGTYVKSFYTTMYGPSYNIIREMGKNKRLHHRITWRNAVPCILREDIKFNNR